MYCNPSRRLQKVRSKLRKVISGRSLLGNASAANASDAHKFAKESAAIGSQFLQKYKNSISRGPDAGSAFEKKSPVHAPSPPLDVAPRLGPDPPAIFTGSGLISDRAKDTLQKVKNSSEMKSFHENAKSNKRATKEKIVGMLVIESIFLTLRSAPSCPR
jgi:hypothetical protein